MRITKIKTLVQEMVDLIQAHGLDEIEVDFSIFGRKRIRLAKRGERSQNTPPPQETSVKSDSPPESSSADNEADSFHTIHSPMVGMFYRSPSPDAAPYVREGDPVSSGQVVCVIEAMKIMNEIESDAKGKIVRILAENAQPVEYHQPLFLVEPTS